MDVGKKVFEGNSTHQIEVLNDFKGWERQFCTLKGNVSTITYPLYVRTEGNASRYGWTKTSKDNAFVIIFGKEKEPKTLPFSYKTSIEIVMPDHNAAYTISREFVHVNRIEVVGSYGLNINNVACLMLHFPGLDDLVREYSAYPDEGVVFAGLSSNSGATDNFSPKTAGPAEELPLHSKADMRMMAYYVILMMNKNIDQQDANTQHREFTTARLKSFSFVVSGGAQCDVNKIMNTVAGATDLSSKMAHYPRFKAALFSLLIASSGPEIDHAKDILKDTAMTPFVMVENFISAEEITLLHIQPKVLNELVAFAKLRKRVTLKYGEYWPFYKLLEPNGSESSLKPYKELQKAALSWKIATGETTLTNYRGVKPTDRYKTLALHPVPDSMKSGKTMTIFDSIRLLQKEGYYTSVVSEGDESIDISGLLK